MLVSKEKRKKNRKKIRNNQQKIGEGKNPSPIGKELKIMTIETYKKLRAEKDEQDYRFYLGELKYFSKIMLSVIVGYIVVGAIMAVFG